jgi:NAD+ kinase
MPAEVPPPEGHASPVQAPRTRAAVTAPRVDAAAIRRVGIVARHHLHQASGVLDDLAEWLAARGVEPVFERHTADLATGAGQRARTVSRDDLPHHADLVLVLGGDGTLLGTADRIAQAGYSLPILGVNFGSLGFLTEITLPELYPALESVLGGEAQVDERLMMRARIVRRGAIVSEFAVLNDVAVTRGTVSRIIDLSVSVDGDFVAKFKADGIILASPTGSTAYNLAAGGPIVHPTVDAFVLTPIAPHTLTNRPVVVPATAEVQIRPQRAEVPQEIFATFDGQLGYPLDVDDVVSVRRAPLPLRLVRAATRNYFEVLRQKLKWAER